MDASGIPAAIIDAALKTSLIEWGAFVTAMLYVYLASKERPSCWIFGIISSALTVYVFFNAKLYYESILNIFYVVVGVYGFYEWIKKTHDNKQKQVTSFAFRKLLPLFAIAILGAVILGYMSSIYTQSPWPYLDAVIASFSVLATWMTAKKIIENWILWIVLDAAGVFLYFSTGLYLFVVLYFMYTVLAIYGYKEWRRTLTAQAAKST